MHTRSLLLMLIAAVSLPACNRSETPPAASTRPADRAAEHLKAAGQELKQAATEAAHEARPALTRAAEEARDLAHRAAEKLSTASSQPATQP